MADPYNMEAVDGVVLMDLPRIDPGDTLMFKVNLTAVPPPPYQNRLRADLLLGYDRVFRSREACPRLDQPTDFVFNLPDGLRPLRYCLVFVGISDDGTSEREIYYYDYDQPRNTSSETREAAVIRAACQNVQRRLGA